jgi:phosphatidylserine/phosphatidylglycerophosphate/cardiolipin synthase-like enzyme
MLNVAVQSYLSPTLVLLAFNWEDANKHPDFLGFAVERSPGFRSADGKTVEKSSWLPNRLSFDGPVPEGQPDLPSNAAPVQKSMCWDNRIDTPDLGQTFTYVVWPVLGDRNNLQLQDGSKSTITVIMPHHTNANGIGTWFNRAVVRSQAFERICKGLGIDQSTTPTAEQDLQLRTWLGNGMEQVVPFFLDQAGGGVGAIYHLTDSMFIIPALQRNSGKKLWLTYDDGASLRATISSGKGKGNPNDGAIGLLGKDIMHTARTTTNIMHNKFIVSGKANGGNIDAPSRVVMGSANYTTEGLTEQANLIHDIESPALAAEYIKRANLLLGDPSLKDTQAAHTGWSEPIPIGTATIRVNFSPEPNNQKTQIDTIVEAIKKASSSVLFCLFSPTDKDLRDACFGAGDRGLMMFGLTNNISTPKPNIEGADPATLNQAELASLEIYHRNQNNRDVIDARYFDPSNVPKGFNPEFNLYPGSKRPPYPPVIIHHKFIVIDGETDHPVIYTGSANMSNNSEHKNDENLLEVKGDTALGQLYLSEFMRLYEHYRARANFIEVQTGKKTPDDLKLQEKFADWGAKYFVKGSAEEKSRVAMVR